MTLAAFEHDPLQRYIFETPVSVHVRPTLYTVCRACLCPYDTMHRMVTTRERFAPRRRSIIPQCTPSLCIRTQSGRSMTSRRSWATCTYLVSFGIHVARRGRTEWRPLKRPAQGKGLRRQVPRGYLPLRRALQEGHPHQRAGQGTSLCYALHPTDLSTWYLAQQGSRREIQAGGGRCTG